MQISGASGVVAKWSLGAPLVKLMPPRKPPLPSTRISCSLRTWRRSRTRPAISFSSSCASPEKMCARPTKTSSGRAIGLQICVPSPFANRLRRRLTLCPAWDGRSTLSTKPGVLQQSMQRKRGITGAWLGVVSADHVLRAVGLGIAQIGHGKRSRLARMHAGDILV